MMSAFTKSHWLLVSNEICYIYPKFGCIPAVIVTGFSWTLINTSPLLLTWMRKILVNMSDVKLFVTTVQQPAINIR